MKYKVGDKVRIKSLDWYKEQDGLIPSWLCPCCGRVMTITVAYIQGYAVEEVQGVLFKDFMIEGLAEGPAISPDAEGRVNEFVCPDGYEFRDENGNVINATKIVLEKKKRYPKTYEEFVELVKKMREAQKRKNKLHIGLIFKKEINVPISEQDASEFSWAVDEMYDAEEEVDKYLINYFKQ